MTATATAFAVILTRTDGTRESHLAHSPEQVADKVWEVVDALPAPKDYAALADALGGAFPGGVGEATLPDGTRICSLEASS